MLLTFLSIVDINGNGCLIFQSWFIAIAHYLTLYVVNKRLNQSFDFTSKNYLLITTKKCEWRQFFEFVLPPGYVTVLTFYAKTSKMNCAFTSLGGLLFNCPSWIFYMMYYNSRALLRYNNSSKIPCTKPWFFPSKFRKISLFMKVLKIGIFGRFLTE